MCLYFAVINSWMNLQHSARKTHTSASTVKGLIGWRLHCGFGLGSDPWRLKHRTTGDVLWCLAPGRWQCPAAWGQGRHWMDGFWHVPCIVDWIWIWNWGIFKGTPWVLCHFLLAIPELILWQCLLGQQQYLFYSLRNRRVFFSNCKGAAHLSILHKLSKSTHMKIQDG